MAEPSGIQDVPPAGGEFPSLQDSMVLKKKVKGMKKEIVGSSTKLEILASGGCYEGDIAGHRVLITAFYGSNNSQIRRGLWEYLRNMESDAGTYPWVIRGDFNVIAEVHESSDNVSLGSHSSSDSFAEYRAPRVSDHYLGIFWTQKEAQIHKPKPFKFLIVGLQMRIFLSSVKVSWLEHSDGNAMHVLFNKLKRLKPILKELKRTYFSDISARVTAKRAELEHIQLSNLDVVNQTGMEEEKKKVESQKKKNAIRILKNENGQFLETFDGMAAKLVDFYNKLIGDADPLVKGCHPEWLKDLLNHSLPAGSERVLDGEVSDKEIKDALFRQGRDKSPGPDGSIVDNTLLAQEIVRGYSRKNLSPRFCDWIKACVTSPRYSIALNGSLVGYFIGARGVRQGDPLSPYLFVMVMNVLSNLLDVAVRNGIFRFHPRCKRISLTYLCFVDDLLVFCHGSLDSVMRVLSILDKFYDLSGLKLNALKTEIYTCGISGGELEQIRRATSFVVGQLPVRSLGVPLVTRKLSGTDCKALLERIKDNLRQWFNRKLSFRGRLQLIKVKGNDSSAQGSMWITWIKAYCFKLEDYWSVESKPHFSWTIRKLIKMREEARSMFTASVNWSQAKGGWIWDNIRDRNDKVE
ncbi:uncharacterized protein LOC120192126 [Hibiscus syriacus]|uniref:uncharacterized protein LOC120192126 n=1 Tax=Hibiscus syriacus TaxID=106335 RepID=UPI001923AE31|nr:uncharacterized protein LOC120192126 [Hibiscus syriacus]